MGRNKADRTGLVKKLLKIEAKDQHIYKAYRWVDPDYDRSQIYQGKWTLKVKKEVSVVDQKLQKFAEKIGGELKVVDGQQRIYFTKTRKDEVTYIDIQQEKIITSIQQGKQSVKWVESQEKRVLEGKKGVIEEFKSVISS